MYQPLQFLEFEWCEKMLVKLLVSFSLRQIRRRTSSLEKVLTMGQILRRVKDLANDSRAGPIIPICDGVRVNLQATSEMNPSAMR